MPSVLADTSAWIIVRPGELLRVRPLWIARPND
jgi:hypothetical protein